MKGIACGFTANIDAKASLDGKLLEKLRSRCESESEPPTPKRPGMYLHSWTDLAGAVEWNMRAGRGGEYIVTSERMLRELHGLADWTWSVGGTGLQAARAAAAAGCPAMVNVPAWTAEYDFLLNDEGLEEARGNGKEAPVHYILEYNRNGRANRIILRGTGEFAGGLIAPEFAARLKGSADRFRALLVSGYNAADSPEEAADLIGEQVRFLRSLGSHPIPVHLELAAFFSREEQLGVIRRFKPLVRSVGCNEDEMAELLGLEGALLKLPDAELLDRLGEARIRLGVRNLIVHTHPFAVCVSDGEARKWEPALGGGIRFAAARAATGRFCTAEEIEAIASGLPPNARGVRLAGAAAGMRHICVVPALEVKQVVGTIGLGDTFAAGLLAFAPGLDD